MKKLLITSVALIALNTHAQTVQNATETPVIRETGKASVTTEQGKIEVKTKDKTISISKTPDSPLTNTITKIETSVKTDVTIPSKEIQTAPVEAQIIYQASDVLSELSQADLDYIKAVNAHDKVNTIESKIVNQEVITNDELKILRKKNPNL